MHSEIKLSKLFKRSCLLQIVYWLLVAAWNVAGLILISMGERPLGPTASLWPVLVLGVVIALMCYLGGKQSKLYPLLASMMLLMATMIVVQAFIKAPDLWPSDAWRYMGVAVNAFGAVSLAMGLLWFVKSKQA